MGDAIGDSMPEEVPFPGTPDTRRNAYSLLQSILVHHTLDGTSPADCGPYEEETEVLIEVVRQQGFEAARDSLEDLKGLRNLYERYDPDEDTLHPLADLRGMTGSELLRWSFPPLEYLVEGVIPEGLSLLVGPPKLGKSLLCLNVATAVATGGKALCKADVQTGRVLYVDLDGSSRGTQRRLKALVQGDTKAETLKDLRRLEYYREFPKHAPNEDKEDAVDYLAEYLRHYGDTQLVVFDTLADVRQKTSGRRNMYETDREALAPFREVFQSHNTSAIFVHHTNKRSSEDAVQRASGSTGLTSAVENVLFMRKTGQHDAELKIRPREEEEQTLSLSFEERLKTWSLEGPVENYAKTEERQQILEVLRKLTADGDGDPVGPKDVADSNSDLSYDNVRQLLTSMADSPDDPVEKVGYGEYLPTTSHRSHRSQSGDDP